MILLTFIYSHDLMFEAVKQEASLLAIRKADSDGNSLFENLVFDEAYLPTFRQLFFNAQGQIIPSLSGYLKDVPISPQYFERQDFSKNRDYTFVLAMPDRFNMHMARPIEDYIFSFIKDHIMYKWLETKSPNDASVFRLNTEQYKMNLMSALAKRTMVIRRRGHWF